MPARLLLLVIGLFPLLQMSPGRADSGQQVLSANPANRDEKKEVKEEARPVETTKKTAFVVRHLDKKQDGFQIAETSHFRILHDEKKPIVEKIGQAAEETRAAVQKKWFGDVATDWDGKCSIYLHPDREKYATKTKMKNTLGHMRTLDWGGVFFRSIHLPCAEPNLMADVLPHEISHSVMSVRFQGRTPRWADEGMAMLAETPASVAECLARLPRYRKNEGLFALEVLLQTEEPDHFNTMEYYAQSTSVVQFLSAQKGAKAFSDFLRTAIAKGTEPALKSHYAITGYSDLEKRWQAFAFPKKK